MSRMSLVMDKEEKIRRERERAEFLQVMLNDVSRVSNGVGACTKFKDEIFGHLRKAVTLLDAEVRMAYGDILLEKEKNIEGD